MKRLNKKRCAAVLTLTALAAGGGLVAGMALANDKPAVKAVSARPYAVELTTQKITLSDAEREMVERVVAAEARGESFEGQAAVAEVIYNRCINRCLSVEEVIWADKQFAYPYGGEISKDTKEAVAAVFDYEILSLDGAEYFHANYVKPYWANEFEEVCKIGGHVFYKN